MMRRIAAFALALIALTGAPAAAQVVTVTETVEVSYAVSGSGSERLVAPELSSPPAALPRGIASFGPFRVLDRKSVV